MQETQGHTSTNGLPFYAPKYAFNEDDDDPSVSMTGKARHFTVVCWNIN